VNEIAQENDLTSGKTEFFFITSAPTFLPSISPESSIPTQTPTITGLVYAVEIVTEVTGELTTEEIKYIESVVLDGYKVDDEDVATIVEYTATGTMKVDLPSEMSEEEATEILTDVIASSLGISPEDVQVSVNTETGEVTYIVTGNSFEEANELVELLEDEENVLEILNANVGDEDGITISVVEVDEEIQAQVTIVIDGDEVSENPQVAENIVDAALGDDFTVTSEIQFVTSAPTKTPSTIPSIAPTSAIPTQRPSITGSVVFVELTQLVTESLTEEDVAKIVASAEETFGVYPENVEAVVTYQTHGEIEFEIEGELTPEEEEKLISELEISIAEALGIHPSNVVVTKGEEEDIFQYTITTPTAEEAKVLQDQLQTPQIIEEIAKKIEEENPSVTDIIEVNPTYGVYAEVELIIDTTNTENIEEAMTIFEDNYKDEWEVESEDKYITSLPTVIPSIAPSVAPFTKIPSAMPTITGLVITVDISVSVTEEYTSDQIKELTNQVSEIYDISESEISTDVDYVISGKLV